METNVETVLTINGVRYVPEGTANDSAVSVDGMKYVIVRAEGAGVFAGYLESLNGQTAVVKNARRLWYWSGAASLSQLAMEGTKKPEDCKFPCEVTSVTINRVLEVLDTTETARKSIAKVAIWEQ